jgi:hypothetical protein
MEVTTYLKIIGIVITEVKTFSTRSTKVVGVRSQSFTAGERTSNTDGPTSEPRGRSGHGGEGNHFALRLST